MKRDISIFSTLSPQHNFDVIIGTHSGVFHIGEVVAISLMHLYFGNKNIGVIRSRDFEELQKCDLLVDIPYDTKFLRTSHVWEAFGESIVENLANKINFKLDKFQISTVVTQIESDYIQLIDEINNGVPIYDETFSYIEAFLPDWHHSSAADFNNAFAQVVKITIEILQKFIYKAIEKEYSFRWILSSFTLSQNRILEIPVQTFPWQEPILNHNHCSYQCVDFVIFPYPDGGWAAQCVPPSTLYQFGKRIPFPSAWAGQTDKLPEISGVTDATFCHINCFFVRGENKESVIKMCEKAIEIFLT